MKKILSVILGVILSMTSIASTYNAYIVNDASDTLNVTVRILTGANYQTTDTLYGTESIEAGQSLELPPIILPVSGANIFGMYYISRIQNSAGDSLYSFIKDNTNWYYPGGLYPNNKNTNVVTINTLSASKVYLQTGNTQSD